MNSTDLALAFRGLAYRDYIAARILLNKGYALQGLTLASSSIEKYIKVFLAAKGLTKRDINVHLDKLDELQALLTKHHFDFTYKFDEVFLELLSKGYRARYYDNLTQPMTISFFIGQFLCELDYAVNIIEQLMKFTDASGNEITSQYKRAGIDSHIDLITNNFIFQGVSKKEFMERPHNGFAVHIDPVNVFKEHEAQGTNVSNEYEGTLARIDFVFK